MPPTLRRWISFRHAKIDMDNLRYWLLTCAITWIARKRGQNPILQGLIWVQRKNMS